MLCCYVSNDDKKLFVSCISNDNDDNDSVLY